MRLYSEKPSRKSLAISRYNARKKEGQDLCKSARLGSQSPTLHQRQVAAPNYRGCAAICQTSHHDGGVRIWVRMFHQRQVAAPKNRGKIVISQSITHEGIVWILRALLHQNKQIRTVSLRRNCSDLFFTLIIHIKRYRWEWPNGYSRRCVYYKASSVLRYLHMFYKCYSGKQWMKLSASFFLTMLTWQKVYDIILLERRTTCIERYIFLLNQENFLTLVIHKNLCAFFLAFYFSYVLCTSREFVLFVKSLMINISNFMEDN